MKLWQLARNKKHARDKVLRGPDGKQHFQMGKRFYTRTDMAILKQDEATHNAELKRGLAQAGRRHHIAVCGCGHEGCFLHLELREI